MMLFSPFEQSRIYSFSIGVETYHPYELSWCFELLEADVHVTEFASAVLLCIYYGIIDGIAIMSNTFVPLVDNYYNAIVYVICLLFPWLLLSNVLLMKNANMLSFRILNTIAIFIFDKVVYTYMGLKGSQYFPFILYTFYVVSTGNLLGLIPNIFSITGQFSFTLFLSSVCWFSVLAFGIHFHGVKFTRYFYPARVPAVLVPVLMFIELISFSVRLASLSLRLFANIIAGHILLDTIAAFFYSIVITANSGWSIEIVVISSVIFFVIFNTLLFFELIIAFLQAYIFVVLFTLYLNEILMLHS